MKKGRKIFLIFLSAVLLLVTLVVLSYTYFFLNAEKNFSGSGKKTLIKNPVLGISDEEAILKFNENFVLYLLYSIGAPKLHNPPLSSDTPKIVFFIDNDIFNVEIIKGNIILKRGNINDEDIMIITSREEAVKMLRDKNYIEKSFSNGKSSFSMVANKLSLFSKGYLNLYEELTGKSAD